MRAPPPPTVGKTAAFHRLFGALSHRRPWEHAASRKASVPAPSAPVCPVGLPRGTPDHRAHRTREQRLVFGIHKASTPHGWVGCAPQGAQAAFALVQTAEGTRPVVHWVQHEPWADPVRTLQRLRRSRQLQRHRRVSVLQRGQYHCLTVDAPNDVPRPEWAAAVRWQLRDAVDFAVDAAAVDVLAVPDGTSHRATPQVIAVVSAEAEMRPLVAHGNDAGLPWDAVDVAETALRNLCLLVSSDEQPMALLHCQERHATLVVTCKGELLSSRQLELSLLAVAEESREVRRGAYEQAALELQRTLDGIERAYGQVTLSRLLVTPMPGVQALCDHLGPLMYVPVSPLDLRDALDWQHQPGLPDDPLRLNAALVAIGAALRTD